MQVSYLYGASGAGKTRSIYETHDPRSIYRVTNYRAARGVSFDGYHGQEVLVFEEFSSQIPIEDMLNYLDIYPLALPARYNDKTACYTMVYITSNLPVEKQYRSEQWDRPENLAGVPPPYSYRDRVPPGRLHGHSQERGISL